jgi:hypothetical protein
VHRMSGDRRLPGALGLDGRGRTAVAEGDGRAAGGARRRAGRPPWLLWAGGVLLVGIGLFTLYLRQSRLAPFNSDGASNMLQANVMLHGNLLLRGWWTSDVSFYTTELPEYMLVEAFRGLRPDVVHICGALTYTLTVLLGALLARGRARGRQGVVRALLAAGIMIAPSILGGTEVFLENPDHAGTAVPILLLLLVLDRAPAGLCQQESPAGLCQQESPAGLCQQESRERWYVPVAVCLLLAWIQVADQLTLVAATAPVAAVAAVRLAMLAVRWRPLREFRYDALLLAAAGLSIEVARAAQAVLRALGGFALHPLPRQLLAPSSQFPANARMMGRTLLLLFGANMPGRAHQQLDIVARFHLIGLVIAAAAFAVALATFFTRRADRVTQIIVAGTVATLTAGIAGTELPALSHAHEVAVLLPFGAVLAGRVLPPLVPARWLAWRPGRAVAWTVLAAWLAAGLAALCYAATWAPMKPPQQALADWLAGHHYTEGLATYWQANSITVTSGGKVLVATVTADGTHVRRWETAADWYDPASRRANFVIAGTDPAADLGALPVSTARAAFGRPARQYQVGGYVVMVYDYNLLTRVQGRTFPGTFPGGG